MRIEAVTDHSHVFLSNYDAASAYPDEHWTKMLEDRNNVAIFGLYKTNDAIGMTGAFRVREQPDTVNFGMSYIRPAYRGLGLSDLFYKARIEWAKSLDGIARIEVGHRDSNEASRRAIQSHGFVLISQEMTKFGNGETAAHSTYELKVGN
jgi:RimJ/RimL family protein N-acetyltransferase